MLRNGQYILRGIIAGVAYAITYLCLRALSMDQWFLPAGLRITALLCLPYRYWPFLMVGESAAVLSLTLPQADRYGLPWAIVSAVVVMPAVAGIVRIFRGKFGLPRINHQGDVQSLVFCIALASLLAAIINKSLGAFLMHGNGHSFVFEKAIVYTLGYFLAGIMLAPLVLAWINRATLRFSIRVLLYDSLASAPVYVFFALLASLQRSNQNVSGVKQAIHLAIFLPVIGPAIWMTVRHGWLGGAVGAAMANICIGLTMSSTGKPGSLDAHALSLQMTLVVISTILIMLGGKISEQFRVAADAKSALRDNIKLARSGFSFREESLKDLRFKLEEHALSTPWTPRLVREEGIGPLEPPPRLRAVVVLDAIYPLNLARYGLYAALESPAFRFPMEAAGIAYACSLRGNTERLSEEVRQTLYRIAYDAVQYFLPLHPTTIEMICRISADEPPKVSLTVQALEARMPDESAAEAPGLNAVRDRAKAFNAQLEIQPHRIHVAMDGNGPTP